MAQITTPIYIDVAQKNTIRAVAAKQFDFDSRYIQVYLTNRGKPVSLEAEDTVLLHACRSDGEVKSYVGSVNPDGSLIFSLPGWLLELGSWVRCEVSVIDAQDRKLTSFAFDMNVEPSIPASDSITEEENYDILITLLADVRSASKEANDALSRALAMGGGSYSNVTYSVDDSILYIRWSDSQTNILVKNENLIIGG